MLPVKMLDLPLKMNCAVVNRMPLRFLAQNRGFILALFVIGLSVQHVAAQPQPLIWSEPMNLSNSPSLPSSLPTVAADQWGNVHVFWLELDPNRVSDSENVRGDAIFYRQYDGQAWSQPLDIFATQDGSIFEYPDVAVDNQGFLHLIWSSENGLLYSQAHISNAAASARAWNPPYILAEQAPIERPQIVIDNTGRLHVVYAAVNADGFIHYLQSSDGGNIWTSPVEISESPQDSIHRHVSPQLVLGENGRKHVAWFEASPLSGWAGTRVWYAYSDDENGERWSNPLLLAEAKTPDEIQGTVSLGISRQNRLSAVWVCGQVTNRCTRSSNDDGETWGTTERIFGDRASRAGWDAMAADAEGTNYLIVQLRGGSYPNAVYYSANSSGRWLDPPEPIIVSGPLVTAHHPDIVVAQGNRIHVVLDSLVEGEIYYMNAISTAPYQAASSPLPGSTETQATQNSQNAPALSETVIDANQPQFIQVDLSPPLQTSAVQPARLLTIGALSALLVICATALTQRYLARRH